MSRYTLGAYLRLYLITLRKAELILSHRLLFNLSLKGTLYIHYCIYSYMYEGNSKNTRNCSIFYWFICTMNLFLNITAVAIDALL